MIRNGFVASQGISPDLSLSCLTSLCKLVRGDPDFRRLESRCHQIAYLKDIAESRSNIPVTINALTRAFDYPRFRVQAALVHRLDEPGQRGKHSALDRDREQQILDWIRQNAEQETPVTRTEIMNYSTSQFKIKFTREWINSFLPRHSDEVIHKQMAHEESSACEYGERFSREQSRLCTSTYRAV
jgi:hypothetical protein